ncbi:hypothetical protein IWX49DRAFT_268514 [Phyllosticta citricarpa]|uniref:GDS1 winged helix domain-containing protein n=1 Tax=Phyllosticta citricarpa TaxID=55181 RepID=A0ABR1L3B7_9PEZI
MPYNTRRKSLSLPMLGIQLPNSSRSSSHRSPPASAAEQPPQKKQKRIHTPASSASPSPQTPPISKARTDRPKAAGRVVENTPPPSPGVEGVPKIDTEGINDDIVVAVIKQLEETGNRPHLLKELAAVLSTQLPIVERCVYDNTNHMIPLLTGCSSANPSAIISSRLTGYIRRPWTALSPCPVGKELVGTHPKRIYFFLNTCPHQPIPEPNETSAAAAAQARIISPSLSSAADESEEDERDRRARVAMSPSPEVDLSSPELDDDSDTTTFSSHGSLVRDATTSNIAHNRRAASPPLERDEREFTATASSLQKRSRSQEHETKPDFSTGPPSSSSSNIDGEDHLLGAEPDSEESAAVRNSEAAALLFGQSVESNASTATMDFEVSSPVFRPVDQGAGGKTDAMEDVRVLDDDTWDWSDWKGPETVELDELDDLLGGY